LFLFVLLLHGDVTMSSSNDFGNDPINFRLMQRLLPIQTNYPGLASTLTGLPSELATWVLTCHTAYNNLRQAVIDKTYDAQGATADLATAIENLESRYQQARDFALDNFSKTGNNTEDYGFNAVFPRANTDKIKRVQSVLNKQVIFMAAMSEDVLPDIIVDRLQDVVDAANAAMVNQELKQTALDTAVTAAQRRFDSDTEMLRKLLSWVISIWDDDDDARLNQLGFARRSQLGQSGGGQAGTATDLAVNTATMMLTWTKGANSTSSKIQIKFPASGGEFVTVASGITTNSFKLPDQNGTFAVRIIEHNLQGDGNPSEELTVVYSLASPGPLLYLAGVFSWLLISGITRYEMQASYDGGTTWMDIFDMEFTTPEYTWSPPDGIFRIRSRDGDEVSIWVYLTLP